MYVNVEQLDDGHEYKMFPFLLTWWRLKKCGKERGIFAMVAGDVLFIDRERMDRPEYSRG